MNGIKIVSDYKCGNSAINLIIPFRKQLKMFHQNVGNIISSETRMVY